MKNVQIYPSILALKDHPETWNQRIAELHIPLAGIHYDIGDGEFVPSKMLVPWDIQFLSKIRDKKEEIKEEEYIWLPIDVHLMVRKPSEYFSMIFDFENVQAVAFHVECDEDIHETIQIIKNAGRKVGLAIMHDTPVDHLDPYLLEVDYIIAMTVRGGYAGDPFIPEVLTKIAEVHHKNPELPIVVDGGVGEKTLSLCIDAGATRAVMSGALFSEKDISWLHKYVDNQ